MNIIEYVHQLDQSFYIEFLSGTFAGKKTKDKFPMELSTPDLYQRDIESLVIAYSLCNFVSHVHLR